MAVPIPLWEGAIFGERGDRCKVYGFSAVSCSKRLIRSTCRFGCGLGCAEGSTFKFNRICLQMAPICTSSIVFARWHQCAFVGATWRIRLSCCGDAALCQITLTTCYIWLCIQCMHFVLHVLFGSFLYCVLIGALSVF